MKALSFLFAAVVAFIFTFSLFRDENMLRDVASEIKHNRVDHYKYRQRNSSGGIGAMLPMRACRGIKMGGGDGHYGTRRAKRTGRRVRVYRHTGIDYLGRRGDPIRSPWDGVVISSHKGGRAGNLIKIRHNNGMSTVYMHLTSRYVRAGQRVKKGQTIGTMGNTGNARRQQVHLHFEVFRGGRRVNPASYFRCR